MTTTQERDCARVQGGRALGVLFAEMALELCSERDPAALATQVLGFAIRLVPCELAGLMVAGDCGGLLTVSDPVVDEADRLQGECGEGPRLLPTDVEAVVCVVDTAADARWPQWGQQVAALGLRSMLSVQLSARKAGLGTLVLYSPEPGWFGRAEQDAAVALARHASVAIAVRREEARLRRMMESGGLIGKAQGLLMERFGIDADQAFTILRRYSQDHNLKLTAVAASLLATRNLPSPLREAAC